jgi:RNA ligase
MTNYKETFDELVREGWLISQVHPTLDLTIYNYSQKTQYEGYWTPETLAARGLVLNSKGVIVARPFAKFFNAEETKDALPNEPFEVYEKMDGSLGIFFWYATEEKLHPVFASRGSFTSDQAVKGWEMLQKLPYHDLAYGHTHMFEIIYPENRIVVDYGSNEKLVLLGVIETASGREVQRENIEDHLGHSFELVKRYQFKNSWVHLKAHNDPNREGYVLVYPNGFRVKVKFEEYVRLHRIITQVSSIDIWEKLKTGESLDEILECVPDEFFGWVRSLEADLKSQYATLENEYKLIYSAVFQTSKDRKEFAETAKKFKHPGLLFSMADGKDYSEAIWKMLRPAWSKPFKADSVEDK